ncbi:serine/threonine-protein kinase [Nocardia stercoris]|uniref:non-specific serine/threonine protein kinase n=1 Tax=Nocardia stercoris TaxID=2483361 RepID=A0A3M2L6D5_9NOCA|nr:serine/threonine-protein kinase [Nocardia stercoris]RMI32290.1 serine/threonine protein kinase [Nocardia stercoris]
MTADRLIAGRYRLVDPVGSGAMGVVWRAEDVRLRRTVAVKQLLLAPGLTKAQALEAKLRAMREGRIAARLHHPNAVTVFDITEEDGQPWLVMEYVDARSLAALMRDEGKMEPQQVADIGAKVAAALAAAHTAGIVHRDVKPANILVADNGTVKLTDFGISRATGDVTVTSTGFLAGTPAYLSPEVARGEDPEPSSDVFALGSTLYAAVEGAPPFGEGENPLAVLHSVAGADVPQPVRAGALGPVLMSLLAADRATRPTALEAQRELEAVAEGRAPSATLVLPQPKEPAADETTVLPGGTAAAEPAAAAAPVPVAAPNSQRTTVVMLTVAVGVLVVVLGVVLVMRNGSDGPQVQASATSTAPPVAPLPADSGSATSPATTAATTTAARPTTTTTSATSTSASASATSTTTTTTSAAPIPVAANAAGFVAGYYGMLPGNVGGAWSMLSPSYQSAAGGYGSYQQFWAQFAAVAVSGLNQNGDTTSGTVTYTYKNGSTTSEHRWFRVGNDGSGHQVILDSQIG